MTKNLAEALVSHLAVSQLSISQLVDHVIHASAEAKGRDVTVLDVSEIFDLADNFVVISGRSDRQVQGIANRIILELDRHGLSPQSIEGFDKGHWILLDYGDVVVHVFYEPIREHYDIESLWTRAKKVPVQATDDAEVHRTAIA